MEAGLPVETARAENSDGTGMKRARGGGDSRSATSPWIARLLWVAVAVALAGRLVLFLHTDLSPTDRASALLAFSPDSRQHLEAAKNFAAGNGLQVMGWRGRQGFRPTGLTPFVAFPPGYSLFVGSLLRLGGQRGPLLVIAFQTALSLASVWLAFCLFTRIFSPGYGLAGAWLLALSPMGASLAVVGLTETLYVFLLLLLLLALERWWRAANGGTWAFTAGLVGGLMALTRSVASHTMWLLPVCALLGSGNRKNRGAVLLFVVLFVTASQGVMGLWRYRNHTEFGRWAVNARNGEHVFFAACTMYAPTETFSSLKRPIALEMSDADAFELDDRLGHEGVAMIRSSPGRYACLHLRGAFKLLYTTPMDFLRRVWFMNPELVDRIQANLSLRNKWPQAGMALAVLALEALAMTGLFYGFTHPGSPRFWAWVAMAWLLPTLVLAGPAAVPRYRFALSAAIMIMAGFGVRVLLASRERPRTG